MLSKKELQKEQIEATLKEYQIVVWCQRTQKPTNEWLRIREEIEKSLKTLEKTKENPNYKLFQIKSKLLRSILNKNEQKNTSCQGHITLYGCNTPLMLKVFLETMIKEKSSFVLGGIYDKKSRSFKEIKKLQELSEISRLNCTTIWYTLIQRLLIIDKQKDFSYLNIPGFELIRTLYFVQEKLKEKKV